MRPRLTRPIIHKFGGAALADATAIRRSVALFLAQSGPRVMVVSALAGITDLLLASLDQAARGGSADVEGFARHHAHLADAMDFPASHPWRLAVEASAAELRLLLLGVAERGTATAGERDLVVARGEILSATLMQALLVEAGSDAILVPATDLIVTTGPAGDAVPDQAATRFAVQQHLVPLLSRGQIPVVPGFIGRGPSGEVMTLGRGGTDLTATLLARAADAEGVVLWKDVPGLLTADPRVVPEARLLPEAHRLEAAELAWYGAKVLHPRALAPLTGTRIPVQIRPFADPAEVGTTITASRDMSAAPVRALAAVRQQTLLTVTGGGVMGIPGIAARLFHALQARDIPVSLVSQASAEAAIDCTVPTAHATAAVDVLRELLRGDIQRGEVDGVERRDGMAIVAVVGLAMAGHPGVAARLFDVLAENRINVVAIAQGSGERNISVVLDEADATLALRRVHAAFQLDKVGGGKPLRRRGRDLVLLGGGTIGRTVLRLLADHPARFEALHVVAVLDRQGAVIDPDGMTPEQLRALSDHKAAGGSTRTAVGGVAGDPAALLHALTGRALVRPILVDMTASDTSSMLHDAARTGWDLVLANKRPLTAPVAVIDALRTELARHDAELRYEATVGAGLPVVESLQQLLATGDRIRSLEGCLSGTLGVVLSALERGVPFSAAVRDARARGFTEPDPRDDLGGVDVARKALILARAIGLRHELRDIAIDSMILHGADLPVDHWLDRLEEGDAEWQARVESARGDGNVLRYVATVTPDAISVGLRALPRTHPLAQLQGAANQLVFTSDRYHDSPLVITGPGAGPEVTATGVLADLLALAS